MDISNNKRTGYHTTSGNELISGNLTILRSRHINTTAHALCIVLRRGVLFFGRAGNAAFASGAGHAPARSPYQYRLWGAARKPGFVTCSGTVSDPAVIRQYFHCLFFKLLLTNKEASARIYINILELF